MIEVVAGGTIRAVAVSDLISLAENVLRVLIEDLVSRDSGVSAQSLGVTDDRFARWEQRREDERKNRAGAVIEERILWYSDFTDLETMLRKNWDLFKPCFGDQKRLLVYLDRLSDFRNPGSHSRALLPFEQRLIEGMTGEIRQQVTIFRSSGAGGPEREYFSRIELISDSFGNTGSGGGAGSSVQANQTGLILRPGDEVTFTGTGWSPDDSPLLWQVLLAFQNQTLYAGSDNPFTVTWVVTTADIGDTAGPGFYLRSNRGYHRRNKDCDDLAYLWYRVRPPA